MYIEVESSAPLKYVLLSSECGCAEVLRAVVGTGSALGLAGAGLDWAALWNCSGALEKPIGNP